MEKSNGSDARRKTMGRVVGLVVVASVFLMVICVRMFRQEGGQTTLTSKGPSRPSSVRARKEEFLGLEDLIYSDFAMSTRCESWPITSANTLPFGGTFLDVTDGSHNLCRGYVDLVADTFASQFSNPNSVRKGMSLSNPQNSLACTTVTPSTILSVIRMDSQNPGYSKVRECMKNRTKQNGRPAFITFLYPPVRPGKKTADISTKAGLTAMILKYTSCTSQNHGNDCIIPETLRITDDLAECNFFFNKLSSDASWAQKMWVIKPSHGYGGSGIHLVTDLQTQLVRPYKDCLSNINLPEEDKVVVQEYIKPALIDGHASYVRTHILSKLSSVPSSSGIASDPFQGWHIHGGNLHVCPEPYSNIGHHKLGKYALTCNPNIWDKHPLFDSNAGTIDDKQFYYEFPQQFVQEFGDTRHHQLKAHMITRSGELAKAIKGYTHSEMKSYSVWGEGAWMVCGVDWIIDDHMKPWLVDLNCCPKKPLYGSKEWDEYRNPMISILRVVFSHFKRQLLKNGSFHEEKCEKTSNMKVEVAQVL